MNEVLDIITYVGTALGAYTALLAGAQLFQDLASERISSQEQLDRVVDEETKKLGIDTRTLVAQFYAVDDKRYSTIRGARSFIDDFEFKGHTIPMRGVDIKEGWGARRGTVRHELYHLHRHFPLRKNPVAKFLRGFFYEEPTATLYATTGIRL